MRPLPLRPPQGTQSFMQLTSHLPTYSRRPPFINIQFIGSYLVYTENCKKKSISVIDYRWSPINSTTFSIDSEHSFQFNPKILKKLKIRSPISIIDYWWSHINLKTTPFDWSHLIQLIKKIKKNLTTNEIRSQHPPFNALKTRLATRHTRRARQASRTHLLTDILPLMRPRRLHRVDAMKLDIKRHAI